MNLDICLELSASRVTYPSDPFIGMRYLTLAKGNLYNVNALFLNAGVPFSGSISGFTFNLAQAGGEATPFAVAGISSFSGNIGIFSFNCASPLLDYAIGSKNDLWAETNLSFSGNGVGYNLASLPTRISNNFSVSPQTEYYPLVGNPSGFLNSGATGNFYPSSNPSGFITGNQAVNTTSNVNFKSININTGSALINSNGSLEFGYSAVYSDYNSEIFADGSFILNRNGFASAPLQISTIDGQVFNVSQYDSVTTLFNTLDDGQGNFSINGGVIGLNNDGSITCGNNNDGASISNPGYALTVTTTDGTALAVNTSYDSVYTYNNTLDDGNGNLIINNIQGGSLPGGMSRLNSDGSAGFAYSDSQFGVQINTNGGMTVNANEQSEPAFQVQTLDGISLSVGNVSDAVTTLYNTLDDGAGNMSVYGTASFANGLTQINSDGSAQLANNFIFLNGDGSATFAQDKCGINSDGSANFASYKAQIKGDGSANFANGRLTVDPSGNLNGHGAAFAFAAKTGNYTLTANDCIISASGAIMLTLPNATNNAGKLYTIKRINSGVSNVTITGTSSQFIDSGNNYALTSQWQVARLVSNGSYWLVV